MKVGGIRADWNQQMNLHRLMVHFRLPQRLVAFFCPRLDSIIGRVGDFRNFRVVAKTKYQYLIIYVISIKLRKWTDKINDSSQWYVPSK